MLPRERVITVIRHGKPDRIPIHGWLFRNLEQEISEAFGSVNAFEDKYEFDLAKIYGGPSCYPPGAIDALRRDGEGVIDPAALLDVALSDPNDKDAYTSIVDELVHHKRDRGRFTYVQTPGIFEAQNGIFGLEHHLTYLLLYEAELHQVYRRQAEWNRAFAHNCLDLGVDMIHVSDDWGTQRGLMFSPTLWWKLIHPYHKIVCDAVKSRSAYVSLHSDGDVSAVVDGIVDLGYDVVHPWQESAGMDLGEFRTRYVGALTVMGGLDVQTTVGFGRFDVLRAEIERVLRMFCDGGLLFCTTHFVQAHCTIEELSFAFDTAYRLARAVCH
jgi:uroporphyrinogen decarboxylase